MPNLDRIARRLDPKRARRWQWLTSTQHSPPTRLTTRHKTSTAPPPIEAKPITKAALTAAPAPARPATPPPRQTKPERKAKAPGRADKPERKIKSSSPAAPPAEPAPKRRGRISLEKERAALIASMLQPVRLIPAAEAAAIKPQGLFEPVDPASLPKPAAPPRSPLAFRSELVAENKQLVCDRPAGTHKRVSAARVFASFDQVRQDALAHMTPPDPVDQRTQRAEPLRIGPTRRQLAELYSHFSK